MNPEESKEATRPREEPHPFPGRPDRKRRTGSRFLLAVALAGVVVGAFMGGAYIADIVFDIFGVVSTGVRLAGKVTSIAILLPAWFYLVERLFLSRSSRFRRNP